MEKQNANVLYNGRFIGTVSKPEKFVEEVRSLRRSGKLPTELNICYIEEDNEVHIFTDDSRLRRPLIVVKNGKPLLTKKHIDQIISGKLTWDDLVKQGIIEYLDAAEEENAYVAIYPEDLTEEHTHLELAPYVFLDIITGCIPYLEHMSFARITIGISKSKRALSYNYSNIYYRTESEMHLLYYTQRPFAKSKFEKFGGTERRPHGFNAVVAILPYDGYNIEDAIIMNRASIERGLFRSVLFKTYQTEQNMYPGGIKDEITIPSELVQGYRGKERYRYLDDDGVIRLEVPVDEYDVLVGKTSPPRFLQDLLSIRSISELKRDASLVVKAEESGIVDSVFLIFKDGGLKKYKVRIRREMIPEIGDKFSTGHGQKGVIGFIAAPEDIPFSNKGIVPDIIFNPHSIPSRMTVSYLLEMFTGKAAALEMKPYDVTPFELKPEEKRKMIEDMRKILAKHGFSRMGTETFYDGITGEKLQMEVFTGVIYYQKLCQMVATKIQSRSRGPIQVLTRQPTEGRAKEGGIKFGEMEKAALVAYGAASTLIDRFLECSDAYEMWVGEKSGIVCTYDPKKKAYVCPIEGDKPVKVRVPYVFKLLIDELIAIGILPRIKTSEEGEEE